jgi:hypothetical protein
VWFPEELRAVGVLVHRLAAYQKYGERLFGARMVVRHRDGDCRNNGLSNVLIGTHHDNAMDQPEEVRQSRAKVASKVGAAAQRKLSADEADKLRADRQAGATYKELMQKYGISKTGVSYIVHSRTYRRV